MARKYSSLLNYALALLPLVAYRLWVATACAPEYGIEFYFSEENLQQCAAVWNKVPTGIFFCFKLLWIFPLIAIVSTFRRNEKLGSLTISALLIFPLFQYLIAYDITRMMCISFPAILISLQKLQSYWSYEKFLKIFAWVFLINFLIPSAIMAREGLFWLAPFWMH